MVSKVSSEVIREYQEATRAYDKDSSLDNKRRLDEATDRYRKATEALSEQVSSETQSKLQEEKDSVEDASETFSEYERVKKGLRKLRKERKQLILDNRAARKKYDDEVAAWQERSKQLREVIDKTVAAKNKNMDQQNELKKLKKQLEASK